MYVCIYIYTYIYLLIFSPAINHPQKKHTHKHTHTQVACIEAEVHDTLRHLKQWMAPEPAKAPAWLMPASWCVCV